MGGWQIFGAFSKKGTQRERQTLAWPSFCRLFAAGRNCWVETSLPSLGPRLMSGKFFLVGGAMFCLGPGVPPKKKLAKKQSKRLPSIKFEMDCSLVVSKQVYLDVHGSPS